MSSSAASAAWTAARPRSDTTITLRRFSRSAHTPAARISTASGSVCAASTSPSCAGVPFSSSRTAKASATGNSASPTTDTAWPANSSRNDRIERTAGARTMVEY